jgi:hypothetical protein
MSKSDDLKPLTIKALFNSNEQYIIPIYQRNYAWGAAEIEQLIQDIYDAANPDVARIGDGPVASTQTQYFIGSLVVYARNSKPNDNKKIYETIDGQQRHTTLCILLAFLKRELKDQVPDLHGLSLNLDFDSRPKSARTLYDLYHNETSYEPEEHTIHAAYDIISRYFKTKRLDANIAIFCQYLLEYVTILRVAVPQDTDLNHYFEIMNNRGEQLEKHEVLKAKFMSVYKAEQVEERNCFSAIWNACSDMNRYVQLGFKSDVRAQMFGADWSNSPESFGMIQGYFKESSKVETGIALSEVIASRRYKSKQDDDQVEKEERFNSIIDFSNFLLHVLKATKDDSVALDDKKLLEAFGANGSDIKVEPTEFIFALLKFRLLFDKYIVKRDIAEKWRLLKLEPSNSGFSYVNSFGKDESSSLNQHIVMILSMFHVSNPALVYKRWLNDALKLLATMNSEMQDIEVDGAEYLTHLELQSDRYFADICFSDGYEDLDTALHIGTGVQNFVFNRLDYLLWKKLTAKEHFDGVDMDYIADHFNTFKFVFRTSVEHYFPQTDPAGAKGMADVDRFGNLCLISPSNNSKLSNYSPNDKKKFYKETKRAESLKQAFMMSYDDWGPDGKGLNNIDAHEKQMIQVLYGA